MSAKLAEVGFTKAMSRLVKFPKARGAQDRARRNAPSAPLPITDDADGAALDSSVAAD